MQPGKEILLEMHRRMVRIREFELAGIDVFKRGMLQGAVHPYIGQEVSGAALGFKMQGKDSVAAPFCYLQASILRVTGRNTPIPSADSLENGVWPDQAGVEAAMRKVLE